MRLLALEPTDPSLTSSTVSIRKSTILSFHFPSFLCSKHEVHFIVCTINVTRVDRFRVTAVETTKANAFYSAKRGKPFSPQKRRIQILSIVGSLNVCVNFSFRFVTVFPAISKVVFFFMIV